MDSTRIIGCHYRLMTRIIALCVAVINIYVAGSHIKITMQITSSLFWYSARRRLLVTDVSGQHIGPVFFTGQASTLKMEPLGCPETSVTNYRCTLRNVPQEGKSRLHLSGSVRSRSR
jgi:hypothetical protein